MFIGKKKIKIKIKIDEGAAGIFILRKSFAFVRRMEQISRSGFHETHN
jgi:hypothetical protein